MGMLSAQDILFATEPKTPEKALRAPLVTRFLTLSRRYTYKALFLWLLLFAELILLGLSLSFISGAAPLALILAALFSTAFTLFMLRLHWSSEKPEVWTKLVDDFTEEFFESHGYDGSEPEHRLLLSNAYVKVAGVLQGYETRFFSPPKLLGFLTPYTRRMSIYWHSLDVLKMRETLLLTCVDELVDLIKLEPLDLELHAALANAYVLIASLYQSVLRPSEDDPVRLLLSDELSAEFSDAYAAYSRRAIEEFKILSSFMPNDPWIHKQLALSYHDMKMPQEERREYEILRELDPEDGDTLFKLGRLYFREGLHAQGLEIYQELLGIDYGRAEGLLECYGQLIR